MIDLESLFQSFYKKKKLVSKLESLGIFQIGKGQEERPKRYCGALTDDWTADRTLFLLARIIFHHIRYCFAADEKEARRTPCWRTMIKQKQSQKPKTAGVQRHRATKQRKKDKRQ